MLHHLVYVSAATRPFTKPELVELLAKAREKNTRLGLTGMLLYKDGDFLQVLEGEEAAVRALFGTIGQDPRHGRVMTLIDAPIAERQFRDWSMGFRNLADDDLRGMPGYSEFMNRSFLDAEYRDNPGEAEALLAMFRDTAR
jgi:Sensors of blue-light using FAD